MPAGAHEGAAAYVVRLDARAGSEEVADLLAGLGARRTGTIAALRLLEVEIDPRYERELSASPLVDWAHRELTLEVTGARPNDPLFRRQWPLQTIGAVEGWRVEDGVGADVTVAVIDSGVDASHPDLRKRTLAGFDFVNLDEDASDDHGHGTHVAGIVAAQPDNRRGIAGVSWGARILPLKACDFTGTCGSFEVAAAVAFAVEQGADIVNISLGAAAGGCPAEFALAGAAAEAAGVLLIASSGNSAQDGNPAGYPASCDGYVSVGATTPQDDWAPFSVHNELVDLAAPGVAVPSTIPPRPRGHARRRDYARVRPGGRHFDGRAARRGPRGPVVRGPPRLDARSSRGPHEGDRGRPGRARPRRVLRRGTDRRRARAGGPMTRLRDAVRRASALAALSSLIVGSLVAGVSAQTPAADPDCGVPGQIVQRGRWEHIRVPAFAAGPQAMTEYGVDPADPARLYATNGVSVAVSSDGGCRWKTTFRLDAPLDGATYSASDSLITDLTVAPGHALLSISQRDLQPHVVLSSYSGETWRRGDEGLRTVLGRALAVGMTRANPGYAYLLVEEGAGSGGARASLGTTVYESTSAGGSWSVRDPGLPADGIGSLDDLPLGASGGLTGLVADPVEAGRLVLYGPDGLFSHQQGSRTQLRDGPVSAVTVLRAPTAPAPTVLVAFEGGREFEVSTDGGGSFAPLRAPGEIDSFAEALRPGDFYVSSGGRVYLRSNGRLTEVPGAAGVTSLSAARSQRQISPFRAESVLTLYGRTQSSIVRSSTRRAIDLLPIPDNVVVGNLGPFAGDPDEALPGTLEPARKEITLREGQTRTVPYELVLPRTPTPLDVFFDVDTTNSMIPALDGLRDAIASIIADLTARKIDAWFGVGQYKSFEAPPAFERMQDIAPPGEGLANALNELRAADGGLETQLESLRQIATGAGSSAGAGIPSGQDAHWRDGSLRIVVNMTDEPISTGSPHPTYEDVAEVMLADKIVHFGIAVQNEATADALGPPLPGLIEIARHTKSFAPASGVDCDGDDDPDLYQGEPLVCVIDHVRSRDASVLGGAIISVLSSLTDVGEVQITATTGDRSEEIAVPTKPLVTGVDFKATNTIRFDVELTCPSIDEPKRFPIDIEAARESGALASAAAVLSCKPKPEPEPPVPPVIPPAVLVALVPPPPPPPPINIGPHPNPNPNAQPNPNPQPQTQGQPQGAIATQRQTQPQLAVVQEREASFRPAEARRGAAEEYALSAYAPPRAGPNQAMLGLAAALVIGFGTALLKLQRAELRLARQRATRRSFR